MIDANLKPWLIEVNYTPSFRCNSPLDLRIKKGLIRDTLNLINVTLNTVDFSTNLLQYCDTVTESKTLIL